MKKGFFLLFVFACCVFVQAQDEAAVRNQLIVQLTGNVKNVFPEYVAVKETLSRNMNILLLQKTEGEFSEKEITELRKLPFVSRLQYNHKIQKRSLVPNDPFFSQQWALQNVGQSGGTAGADISATKAWEVNHSNVTVYGDSIVIAIVDDPMDLSHEDINYFINHNEIDSNGIDDDGNGYIDDYRGWDAINNRPALTNSFISHGTHVAGIAGAIGNNGKGISGVCWGAKILPVYGSTDDEAKVIIAYDYVMEMRKLYNQTSGAKGAFIVATNSSFGVDRGNPVNFPIWCSLYDSLGKLGILSAVATANQNWNIDVEHDIPTECPSDYLIAVTSTSRNDNKNSAGYGAVSIDLGAPGSSIYSSIPVDNYGVQSGTSMAAPHVAGALGSMYATACEGLMDNYLAYPDSFSLYFKNYLLNGVDHISSLQGKVVSNGRLNLYKTLLNVQSYNCNDCPFDVDALVAQPNCQDSASGSVSLSASAAVTYQWSTGELTSSIQNKPAGIYTVTATSAACSIQRSFFMDKNPHTIVIDSILIFPVTDAILEANIIVFASVGNGSLSYAIDSSEYQLSGGFPLDRGGYYTIHIRNENACVVDTTVFVGEHMGVEDFLRVSVRLYPNPAKNIITVIAPQVSVNTRYFIIDVNGRLIKSGLLTEKQQQIFLDEIADGVYLFEVSSKHESYKTRFAVMR